MDVTCERCSTEYEFDDALVSGRGTTVKCTNCGHQFKVRRSDGVTVPERWRVRTVDGRELEFTALRELQAAITGGRVRKDDVLSRDNARPRRLGSIAELEPFFVGVGGQPGTTPGLGPARPRMPTPQGLGVMQSTVPYRSEGSVAIPLPISPPRKPTLDGGFEAQNADEAPPPLAPRTPAAPAAAGAGDTAISPIAVPTPRPEPGLATAATINQDALGPARQVVTPTPPAVAPVAARAEPPGATPRNGEGRPVFAGAAADFNGIPEDPPTQRRAVGDAAATDRFSDAPMASGRRAFPSWPEGGRATTPTPTDVRASYSDDAPSTEPRFSTYSGSRQRGRARWIVGVVVLGMLTFAGVTVGRRYLSVSAAPSASASAPDPRVAGYLREGEQALADGDVEAAKEAIDKAGLLGESDPAVAIAALRLAVVRADVAWLRVRILADGDSLLPSAKRDLEQTADRANKAAEHASKLAPGDPAVLRHRVDALRLAGDRAAARALVGGLGAQSTNPEAVLALAALDLAEDKPDWRTVVERLRSAGAAEQNLGRAKTMLVYALARSGALADARAELDRLAALPKPHPLVQTLRVFVDRLDKEAGKVVDASQLPDARRPGPAATAGPVGPGTGKPPRGDDGRVPDDYVWPGASDTPAVKTPPPATGAATAAPTATPAPPPVETSDIPKEP